MKWYVCMYRICHWYSLALTHSCPHCQSGSRFRSSINPFMPKVSVYSASERPVYFNHIFLITLSLGKYLKKILIRTKLKKISFKSFKHMLYFKLISTFYRSRKHFKNLSHEYVKSSILKNKYSSIFFKDDFLAHIKMCSSSTTLIVGTAAVVLLFGVCLVNFFVAGIFISTIDSFL